MKRYMYVLFRVLGLNPKLFINSIKGLPFFFKDWIQYAKLAQAKDRFKINLSDLYPVYPDRFDTAGVANGHYFHQDLWAAKLIYKDNPEKHVDIGSRIDGFVSHLLVFREVTVVDVRPLQSKVEGLTFRQSDIRQLNFDDNSLESVSCLHAIEHIGLGRYGDNISTDGWEQGLRELERVLQPGGKLYLGVPIGRERLCFNAHRVFAVTTILETLKEMKLVSFSYVDDKGDLHMSVELDAVPELEYGCGLFHLVKE